VSTLLGFDYGTHKIGVAIGQSITATASPLTTLTNVNHKPDWDGITRLVQEWQPDMLIVGIPYQMDDQETEIAGRAKRFARQLHGRYQLRVEMVDERLTTREAWSRLGLTAHKTALKVDAFAAKLILETWLND